MYEALYKETDGDSFEFDVEAPSRALAIVRAEAYMDTYIRPNVRGAVVLVSMTAKGEGMELRNTELGDECVTHGGTFTGSYDDVLGANGEQAICSEVVEGFQSGLDLCRFVEPARCLECEGADDDDDVNPNHPYAKYPDSEDPEGEEPYGYCYCGHSPGSHTDVNDDGTPRDR